MLQLLAAAGAGFLVAAVGTPAGVSGAVFLLPVQLSVLGLSGPAVSATNLLFNVVSTPLALRRLRRHRNRVTGATAVVVVVAVPAAALGALTRVSVLAEPGRFRILVVAVLLPLGLALLWRTGRTRSADRRRSATGLANPPADPPADRPADLPAEPPACPLAETPVPAEPLAETPAETPADPQAELPAEPLAEPPAGLRSGRNALVVLTACAAALGGALGIGGGSILGSALVALTPRTTRISAPLALTATLATSITGLVAYSLLGAAHVGSAPITPYWGIGIALGCGGMVGGLVGSSAQPHLSERLLTAGLGTAATATALAYLVGT